MISLRDYFAKPVASVAVTAEHRVHPVDFILSHNSVISFFDPDFDFDYANSGVQNHPFCMALTGEWITADS